MLTNDLVEACLKGFHYVRFADGSYRHEASNENVEHFLYVERFGAGRSQLTMDFGFRNSVAQDFAAATIERYGHALYSKFMNYNRRTDCLIRFPFWRFFAMTRNGWAMVPRDAFIVDFEGSLNKYMIPFVESVGTLPELFLRLAADEEPCPWFAGNAAIRASELCSIAKMLDMNGKEVRDILLEKLEFISAGLGQSIDPTIYVDHIIEEAALR
jgi:hypothetical protein